MVVLSASVPSGCSRAGWGDDQGVGQRIVGERIERLAESRSAAKFCQRFIGRDHAHRGDVAALAQLLRERRRSGGARFLVHVDR